MKARTLPVLLLPLLVSACGGLRAPARTVPEPERLSAEQGRTYLDALADVAAGRRAEALLKMDGLASVRPLHVPSHLLRQDLLREEGRLKEATAEYAALAAEPDSSVDAEVLRIRVTDLDPTARVAAYQAAAVRDASSPWPRVALAVARMVRSMDFEARSREQALKGFVVESRTLHEEAMAAAGRARTEAERAVALAPDLAASHGVLARVLAAAASLGRGSPEESRDLRGLALEACGKSLAIDPGDPRVLLERGLLFKASWKRDEALRDFQSATLAAPLDREILAEYAQALASMGRTGEALDAWESLLEMAPDWAEAWMDGGSAALRAGLLDEALERYRRADLLYGGAGGERWRALEGMATTLAQMGLDQGDPAHLAEALESVRAYAAAGGPDRAWVDRMTYLLAGDEAAGAADGGQ